MKALAGLHNLTCLKSDILYLVKSMVQKGVRILSKVPKRYRHCIAVPGPNFGAVPCGCSANSNTFSMPGSSIKHEVGAAGTQMQPFLILQFDFSLAVLNAS